LVGSTASCRSIRSFARVFRGKREWLGENWSHPNLHQRRPAVG